MVVVVEVVVVIAVSVSIQFSLRLDTSAVSIRYDTIESTRTHLVMV